MLRVVHLRNFVVLFVVLFVRNADAGWNNRRIFPTSMEVREGEDIQVRLVRPLENEVSCYVKTPLLISYNLKLVSIEGNSSYDGRLYYWSVNGACGFYLTNVQKQDQGWWRLTSKGNENGRLMDAVMITVLDKLENRLTEHLELAKGLTYTLMFSDDNEYCVVWNPLDPYKIIRNDMCNVEIEKVSGVDSGNWSAVIGVKGQIEEVVKTINVSVFHDHINSGYTISSDSKVLNLYCNIESFEKTLTMCRFAKHSIEQVGLRLHEGARKGKYGYYGNGFAEGECGLTIESPEEEDYVLWYCVLNVQGKPSVTAVIDVSKSNQNIFDDVKSSQPREFSTSRLSVITTENEELKLECSVKKLSSYCWFSQPDGETFYLPKEKSPPQPNISASTYDNLQTFWFDTCSVTIKKVEKKHNGTWICHIGPAALGVEITQQIDVRISETPLAATDKFVFAAENSKAILQCNTAPRAMALSYCRFHSPIDFGINIDERVTENNPILYGGRRYWYHGLSLGVGHCGLVIEPVNQMDAGNWTCAAKLEILQNDNANEIHDQISFTVVKTNVLDETTSTAGATISISFSVIGFIIGIGFLLFFVKKRWNNHSQNIQRASSSIPSGQEIISLDTMTTEVVDSSSTNGSNSPSNIIPSPSNRNSIANISMRSSSSNSNNSNVIFNTSNV